MFTLCVLSTKIFLGKYFQQVEWIGVHILKVSSTNIDSSYENILRLWSGCFVGSWKHEWYQIEKSVRETILKSKPHIGEALNTKCKIIMLHRLHRLLLPPIQCCRYQEEGSGGLTFRQIRLQARQVLEVGDIAMCSLWTPHFMLERYKTLIGR